MFNRLVKEKGLEFSDIKDKVDLNYFVCNFSSSENKSQKIGNYHMPQKEFEDLRDGDINPKEVLKIQVRFKSDLSEIKRGNKSVNQKKLLTFFISEKKLLILLEIILFCYLMLSAK